MKCYNGKDSQLEKGVTAMAHLRGCWFAPIQSIKNLTHRPRTVYADGGELVTLAPAQCESFENPDIYYVVEQHRTRQLLAEGVDITRLFYFTKDSQGRDGIQVCMIRNVGKKDVRLMPRGT